MKVLLDVNILLDVVLQRAPWDADAVRLCDRIAAGAAEGFVAASSLPTLFYVCRRSKDLAAAFAAVDLCLRSFDVAPTTRSTILAARSFEGSDFEDNIQSACAVEVGASFLITRDKSGFKHSPVPALTAGEVLLKL